MTNTENPQEHNTPSSSDNWQRDGFGELYPIVYAHRTVEAARPEAMFAVARCEIRPEDRLLDLCCGNGRHLVHLLQHTEHAFGLDFSPVLLLKAQEQLQPQVPLCRGDMKCIPFPDQCFDVVTNFFTSFGYFEKDTDNNQVLGEIARVLKPNGRFFIDHMNPEYIRATLVPESSRASKGYSIEEQRWIDTARRRVNKATRVTRETHLVGEWVESVRFYERTELTALLHQVGLNVSEVAGNYPGSGTDQPRQIMIGRKD